jgi:hypothetical protein
MATKPMSCGPDRGSVQKLVGFGGHRYDRSGDVDLGVVNALGIAIDRDGPMPHAALARLCRVPNYSEWMLVSVETVQNLGVLTPRAGTGGGPTARRQRDPAQASSWRSRSEPSASDERLVVTSACVAVRSFAGVTASARYFP